MLVGVAVLVAALLAMAVVPRFWKADGPQGAGRGWVSDRWLAEYRASQER